MKKIIFITAAIILVSGISGGVYWFVTRDIRAVKSLLDEAAGIIRKKPSKLPHAGVLKFSKVDDVFAHKIEIRCGYPAFNAVFTNEDLKMIVSTVNRRITRMEVNLAAIEVEISGKDANFSFDAEFSGSTGAKGDELDRVYQVSGKAEKSDGKWKISALTAESIVK